MVLTVIPGGAAGAGRTPAPAAVWWRGQQGSQALEFAMVVPLLGVLVGVLLHTGLLLADVVLVQGIAREVGRTAAVDGPDRARDLAEQLTGDRDVRLDIDRDADGVVRTRVEVTTGAFQAVGADLWLPATAAFRAEAPDAATIGD